MNSAIQSTLDKIADYKRKFYKNQLIKGILISAALIVIAFMAVTFLEFLGRFGTFFRLLLLLAFLAVCAYTLWSYIIKPLLYLFRVSAPLSDEEAAKQIGTFFPAIKDKLVNTIQLAQLNSRDNALVEASIHQKTEELKWVRFADAINLAENKRYLKYAVPPLLLLLFLSAVAPSFFNSSERIVKFNKTFADPAPFSFHIVNENLEAIRHEDFHLTLRLDGSSLPEEVFLVSNGRRFKMTPTDDRTYTYIFRNLQEASTFHFLAAGFTSNEHQLNLSARPNLLSFNVSLRYPAYLGKKTQNFDNVGNLVVPEGTIIRWLFKTNETEKLSVIFDSTESVTVDKGIFTDFNFERKIARSSTYELLLQNKMSTNATPIHYFINVIPDRYPQINFEQIIDSSLYNYIGIGGDISDDYGITDFRFAYRSKGDKTFKMIPIPFNKTSISQTFFYQVDLAELGINRNDQLEYYLIVTDNDGVNGRKSTKSALFTFNMPSSQEYAQDVEKEVNKTEDKFQELVKKTKSYKQDLADLENELKRKKELDFQDKKDLERLISEKEQLNQELQKLREQLQDLMEKQSRFEAPNPKIQEKMDLLQQMLNELMQNEDSKVLEDLKKLLEKSLDEKSLEKLENFNKHQRNLDKELDRTLNLFKELQRKQKIEEAVSQLNELAEQQEELPNNTQKNTEQEQERLNKAFEDLTKKLEEIEEKSAEMQRSFDPMETEQNDIIQEQNSARSALQKQQKDQAAQSQKNAAKKMKQMAENMEQQMQSTEMQQTKMDLGALREILENLIKTSHDQERIMKDFRSISLSDPRFVTLSQEQLNIANDTKIIEDSLFALANRVMQLQSMVTKEVTLMKNNIDESVKLIRERKLPNAAAKQQTSMTSMNNLALMLSDVFKQMQQQMASMGSGKGKEENQQPGDFGKQQQQLNERLQGIGAEGKTPREISEEIAKLVHEQAKLRKQLQDMQEKLNGTEAGKKIGQELKDIQDQMEKSEEDLVNKRITPELKRRQSNIETRLLETDKAIKEQEMDPTRKGRAANNTPKSIPPDLEKFKREKEKQVELLRTTPPHFTPFYKNQTDNYFKRIN